MPDREHLLTTKEMARFVADGYLRFDALVPGPINEAAHRQMEAGIPRPAGGSRGIIQPPSAQQDLIAPRH